MARTWTVALLAVVVSAAVAALAGCDSADSRTGAQASASVRLLRVATFRSPTYLTAPPGDRRRRFVTERAGRIRVVRDGRKLRRPFLDIRDLVQTGGESGLLSLAFAPDYETSRRFYVYFVANDGDLRVEQYQRSRSSPDRASRATRNLVISQRHDRVNHKGGQVQFGPDDRLYVGFGDGGGAGDPDRNGQDKRTLLGKLLRIAPRPGGGYRTPASNPFADEGGRDEIYAYGLRNPYRFSFDRRRGHLTVGDVGQDAVEEINLVRNVRGRGRAPRGGYNFGWSVFEGRRRFRAGRAPGHRPPALQRLHSQGSCSITGGYVVRDRRLGSLYGRYVYGDLCDSRLRVARLGRRRLRRDRPLGLRVSRLVSFGEDARGRLHAVSLDGPVYRIARR